MSPCRPDDPANDNDAEPWDYQEIRMPVGVEHWRHVNECLWFWLAQECSVPPQSIEEQLSSWDLLQELLRRPELLVQMKLRFWAGPGVSGPIRRYHGSLDGYGTGAYGSGTYGSD